MSEFELQELKLIFGGEGVKKYFIFSHSQAAISIGDCPNLAAVQKFVLILPIVMKGNR